MGKNDEQTELCHNAILKNQARYTTIPCNKTEIAKQMRDLTLEWTIAHVVIKCNILFQQTAMGTCRHCYKDFKTPTKLKQHVVQYHKKPVETKLENPYNTFNYILCVCQTILPSSIAFKNHVVQRHLQLPYGKCMTCQKSFSYDI